MTSSHPGEGARALRLAAYSVVAISTFAALVLLASVGSMAAHGQELRGTTVLARCLQSVLCLTIAFATLSRLMRSDDEQATRGRAVTVGARAPGWFAAATVAAQCLVLTLLLMAGLEVVGRSLPTEDSPETSRGAAALERARREASDRGTPDDPQDGAEGSNDWQAAPNQAAGIVGSGSASSVPNEDAVAQATVGNLLSGEPVLRVRSDDPPGAPSVHLRGLTLDQYGAGGILRERRWGEPTLRYPGDDGWIELGPESTGESQRDASMELTVEYVAHSNGLIFAPSELIAVQTEAIRFTPGSDQWALAGEDKHRYRTRSEPGAWPLEFLAAQPSRKSIAGRRFTSLPDASPRTSRALALEALQAYALGIAGDSTSDLEAVIDVVTHLRQSFGYELYDTSFLSPERCLKLIERGSGSCSHFASLAAIMLRSLDIPTRIAVGYVAREPLEGEDGWLVRARDGHAWIEVHFEGLGWLTFDPTPGDGTSGGAEFRWAPVSDEDGAIARWSGAPEPTYRARTSALGDWVVGTVESSLRSAGDALHRWFGSGVRTGSAVVVALFALFWAIRAAVGLLRKRRLGEDDPGNESQAPPSRRARPEAPTRVTPLPPLPEAQALMGALEAREWRQERAETPSQFARRVEEKHQEASGLFQALRVLMRRATTRANLTATQSSGILELSERIERPSDGPHAESGRVSP